MTVFESLVVITVSKQQAAECEHLLLLTMGHHTMFSTHFYTPVFVISIK